jgi:outer membrane scaffolding protein for murein synthesis (MipA/OmpV family)
MRHTTALSLAALLTAGAAHAQDSQNGQRSVTGTVGVGAAIMPRYVGSDEYRVMPMPIISLEYKNRLYLGGSSTGVGGGVGAYVVRNQALTWSVDYNGSEARPERRGDALAGMGRRHAASFAGTSVAYTLGTVTANAGVAVGLGRSEGSYGTVGLSTQRQLTSRWVGSLSTGATVASARNMAFDFGVSDEQSAARRALIAAGDTRLEPGDGRAYAPKGGLKEFHGGASLAFLVNDRMRLLAFAQGTRLSHDAELSPLVRARDSGAGGIATAFTF